MLLCLRRADDGVAALASSSETGAARDGADANCGDRATDDRRRRLAPPTDASASSSIPGGYGSTTRRGRTGVISCARDNRRCSRRAITSSVLFAPSLPCVVTRRRTSR